MPHTGETKPPNSPAVASCAQTRTSTLAAAYRVAGLEPAARRWQKSTIQSQAKALRLRLSSKTQQRIDAAIAFCQANGLTPASVEQEDFRLPEFAAEVAQLRRHLDTGPGFVIVQGLPTSAYQSDQQACDIIAWGLANYIGRPLRQGIHADRRLFSVSDRGSTNLDPTRIGASAKRSPPHTDNGCLEPRAPDYVALCCIQAAIQGGESVLLSARSVFATIASERPDLLPLYFDRYAFRSPQLHVWPAGKPYVCKPIFEVRHQELQVHYARVMVEPGMVLAGTPLTARQREALDYLDEVLQRDELCYRFSLQAGEMLILNNLILLHGREAFTPATGHTRLLKRLWLRRRHLRAGDDPAALDLEEYP